MTDDRVGLPPALRARLSADYAPVRRLPPPSVRALTLVPFGILSLLAAQWFFMFRPDAARLGWTGTWGFSLVQAIAGLALVTAGLKESVPGRGWSRSGMVLWLTLPLILIVAVTYVSWDLIPIRLRCGWLFVSAVCFVCSAVSALPAVVLASVLAARAYPIRPLLVGALLGLGAGLMADAGWRLFCHFSEPPHVLVSHLGGVVAATLIGAALAPRLGRQSSKVP